MIYYLSCMIHGLPIELAVEEAFKRNLELGEHWLEEFDAKMTEQRELSQTATEGALKCDLGGDLLQHRCYHTVTHLLQSALLELFGPELRQHGSNVTEDRLRLDFNLDYKMADEESSSAGIRRIEAVLTTS